MKRLRSTNLAVVVAVFAVAVSGCNKNKPKPAEDQKSEATAVPSGLVFNDFLPATGAAAGLGVRDAGLDGGLGVAAADEGPTENPAEGGDKVTIKVTDPGAEPRAVRKYTFVANKVDKRVLTMTRAMSQSAGGQTSPAQEMTSKIYLDLTPKQVRPTGATIEAKVTKVELPGAPPQISQMLAAMNGVTGAFEVSPQGEVGEVSFGGLNKLQGQQQLAQMAQQILEGLSQGVQLLLAPLPTAPVGVGAKWEMATKTEAEQGAKRFTLKEVSNEGGVVDSDIEIKVPRRATQSPRGGGPMFVEIDGRGHYSQQLRFNQTSPRAEGELTVNEKIELSEQKGGPKQTVLQTQKAKQLIETPGK